MNIAAKRARHSVQWQFNFLFKMCFKIWQKKGHLQIAFCTQNGLLRGKGQYQNFLHQRLTERFRGMGGAGGLMKMKWNLIKLGRFGKGHLRWRRMRTQAGQVEELLNAASFGGRGGYRRAGECQQPVGEWQRGGDDCGHFDPTELMPGLERSSRRGGAEKTRSSPTRFSPLTSTVTMRPAGEQLPVSTSEEVLGSVPFFLDLTNVLTVK